MVGIHDQTDRKDEIILFINQHNTSYMLNRLQHISTRSRKCKCHKTANNMQYPPLHVREWIFKSVAQWDVAQNKIDNKKAIGKIVPLDE